MRKIPGLRAAGHRASTTLSVLACLAAASYAPAKAGELRPCEGESARGVDPSTMAGKVLCGYQGWFTAPGDGSDRGWRHYPRDGKFEPGRCSIDLWPDVGELDPDEKFPTPFRHKDGAPAFVFSSHSRKTVLRHFAWMREHAIDGVFVQRFAVETLAPRDRDHCDAVLAHCREGANRHGRVYAVMYDLSGLAVGGTRRVIDDWKRLVDGTRLARDEGDRAYLRENGRPVVALWGIGFNDGRRYTLDECADLIRFLKSDKKYGGCSVMLGVPSGWRTLDRDSVPDRKLHDVLLLADAISPWTVGRFASPEGAVRHAETCLKPDLAWCRERGQAYLPVAFPGFSWHNMRPSAPLNQIPRLEGRFFWKQLVEATKAGAATLYVAMFDELDEATAIFKCTNDPPVGASPFVTFEGLPSDEYLRLTGLGGKLLRGEIEPTDAIPPR